MKIIGICGSLRKDSYNKKIMNYIEKELMKNIDFKFMNITAPLYNDDLDISDEMIVKQKEIKDSDAVIIVTPEYNYSIPGVLKNFLDWMSIEPEYPFDNKKVAIISGSTGMLGGVRCQLHLREVLRCLNANVVNGPEVFIGNISKKINNDEFNDEKGMEVIKRLVSMLID